eukprot:gb/GEZJ01006810.1/.p1 GENE.gb/GEZJ01006810.1/~~gb/GEZJ01006810.1/.p1  ORF type:complete len:264 (-),score=16.34 gb/GEZJ01006810.1/:193-984(-)
MIVFIQFCFLGLGFVVISFAHNPSPSEQPAPVLNENLQPRFERQLLSLRSGIAPAGKEVAVVSDGPSHGKRFQDETCCKGEAKACLLRLKTDLWDGPPEDTNLCLSSKQNGEKVCAAKTKAKFCVHRAKMQDCIPYEKEVACDLSCSTFDGPMCFSFLSPMQSLSPSPICKPSITPTPRSSPSPKILPSNCCSKRAEICKIKRNGTKKCIARGTRTSKEHPCFEISSRGRGKKCCLTAGAARGFPSKNCYRASRRRDCTAKCL